MNILLLGSGGREHALAWKMCQSERCTQLFIAPGNAGTANEGINVPLDPMDFEEVKDFVLAEDIELVVVGPEAPLVAGIYDFFKADDELQSIAVVGPSQAAAALEGSKDFAKEFMKEFGIPTAAYQTFTASTKEAGLAYIAQQKTPIVLKADGLAAGKGVLICATIEEAQREFSAMLDGKFGEASATIVIEDFLKGREFSVFVLTDGKNYKILPAAKDYKRIGEGDTGLNTGGMGAISPVPFLTDDLMEQVETKIVQPTLTGIQSRELAYKGFIFLGLIEVDGTAYVIEYNCRMGDPETQVVLPRMEGDLVNLLYAAATDTLDQTTFETIDAATAAVILVSGGYPESYQKGKKINGLDGITKSTAFHAGTRQQGEDILTSGGRVLALMAYGKDVEGALKKSKACADEVDFEGKYYRSDIGFDVI